jgi:hypothetical protein
VIVQDSPGAGTVTGELAVVDSDHPGSPSGKRVIEAASCDEALEALALFAALSIDPSASTAPLPATTPLLRTGRTEPSPPPPAPMTSPSADRPSFGPPPALTDAGRWHLGVGLAAAAMDAGVSAPVVLFSPMAVEIGYTPFEPSPWAPSARLSFSSTAARAASTPLGYARLRWDIVQLEGCPIRFPMVARLYVRPCVAAGAGVLSAAGEEIAHPQSQARPWASIAGSARLEWVAWSPVTLELEAGAMVPLVRDGFHFEPAVPAYRTPSFMVFGGAGAGVRFF